MEYRSVAELWTAFLRAEPRARIEERLHDRIDRAGGDDRPARIAEEHRPDGPHDGASCTACHDEQWPCPVIADLLRP